MKFLIDENADSRLIPHLTGLGHDATFIVQTHGPGIPDEEVLAIAHAEESILINIRPGLRRPSV